MTWFDRQQVAAALEAGKISADEDAISHLDKWLYICEHLYRLPSRRRHPPTGYRYIETVRCGGPSKEIKKLHKARHAWLNSENDEVEVALLYGSNPSFLYSLSATYMSVSKAITWLELAAKNHEQQVTTAFFIALYKKWGDLSGKRGLSDGGPAIRFMARCASIVDVPVPKGLRRRVQQAMVARDKRIQPGPPVDCSALFEEIALFYSGPGVFRLEK